MSVDKVRVAFLIGESVGITESIRKYDRSPDAQDAVDKAWNDTLATLNDRWRLFTSEEYGTLLHMLHEARGS